MGNPKLPRRKYDTPSHPWQGDRIKFENEVISKFGLKNKREVWKAQSLVHNFRHQARQLNARLRMADVQAEKEKNQLLERLTDLGVLMPNSNLNDVLSLGLEGILNRRLQTQVYLKGLAHSTKQARQFIVHGHISIDGRKVTIPGYFVKHNEEAKIEYHQFSSLTNELHPMRPKPKVGVTIGEGQVSRLITLETSESKTPEPKPASKTDAEKSAEEPEQLPDTKSEEGKGEESAEDSDTATVQEGATPAAADAKSKETQEDTT